MVVFWPFFMFFCPWPPVSQRWLHGLSWNLVSKWLLVQCICTYFIFLKKVKNCHFSAIFPEILRFFTYISKSVAHRVSNPVPNGGFWGMTSHIGIFVTFSDSKWPPSSHFFPKCWCFSHISPKVLQIEYPFQFQMGGFEVWRFLWEYLQSSQIQDGRPAANFSRNFVVFYINPLKYCT